MAVKRKKSSEVMSNQQPSTSDAPSGAVSTENIGMVPLSPRATPNERTSSVQFAPGTSLGSGARSPSVASTRRPNNPSTRPSLRTRLSTDSSQTTKHHEGIYWRSPLTMITFFFFGLLTSIGHHVYYHSLDGRVVGNDRDQQWALRWGTTLAYITQVSLVASIAIVYTQWIWKTLKNTPVKVSTLDAVFAADTSLIALANWDMITKIRVGTLLALACGLLPLTSLVPPTTLFVHPDLASSNETAQVRLLDMYNSPQMVRFAHWAYVTTSEGQSLQFLGPRSIVTRLSRATTTQGAILPIPHTVINSTYTQQFYGPSVHCSEANSSTALIIEGLRADNVNNTPRSNIVKHTNYYYAFVPDLSNSGNSSAAYDGVVPITQARQDPRNATNELWMAYSPYTGVLNENGEGLTKSHYIVCRLFNSSYDINILFEEGIQNITNRKTQILNPVEYPNEISLDTPEFRQQQAYSAVFWALTDPLVGSMDFFIQNTSGQLSNFSQITTDIKQTNLIGSPDLSPFIDSDRPTNLTHSDQRQEDMDIARNLTLDVLMEELAFNVTTSFMSSRLLSPLVNTTIIRTDSVNIYAYHAKNLLLAYGIAIFIALIANILGAIAYRENKVSHSKDFSAILTATQHDSLRTLFHDEILGRLPLSKAVRNSVLRFQELIGRRLSSNIRFSSFGFVAEDMRPLFDLPEAESDRA